MGDKARKGLDRVVQLNSSKLPMLSGICIIDGIERKVEAFRIPKGTSAAKFEFELLERAYDDIDAKMIRERNR